MNIDNAVDMDLQALRHTIDEADERLLKAFTDRMEAARAIAEYKARNGLPVYDPEREREVAARQASKAEPELRVYVERLYDALFTMSREIQEKRPTGKRS